MAEVPEGGAELERVARRAPGCGLAVGDQAGEGLMQLLGAQSRAQLDNALDLVRSGVSLGVRHAGGDDDRLARSGHMVLAVEGEVGFARQDGEALFLAGMDVLGDHPAGHAAPGEPDQLPVIVLGDGGVGDPLAGGRDEEGPEPGRRGLCLRHDHPFVPSEAGPDRVRYQATVAAMASASGVPAGPKTDSYLVVSMTKGSPNW